MKLIACGVIGVMMSFVVAGAIATDEERATAGAAAQEFRAFLREFEQGTDRFINGDATLWNKHVSYAARGSARHQGAARRRHPGEMNRVCRTYFTGT